MELKNKKTKLELNQGEEVIYSAVKTKFNYYIHIILFTVAAVFVCFLLLQLVAFYNITLDMRSLWIYLVVYAGLFSVYKRMRDYFFVDFILTNQRILIIEYGKLTSIEFPQVEYALAIHHIFRPDMVKIKLKNQKIYQIDFVNEKELNNQLKTVLPEKK